MMEVQFAPTSPNELFSADLLMFLQHQVRAASFRAPGATGNAANEPLASLEPVVVTRLAFDASSIFSSLLKAFLLLVPW